MRYLVLVLSLLACSAPAFALDAAPTGAVIVQAPVQPVAAAPAPVLAPQVSAPAALAVPIQATPASCQAQGLKFVKGYSTKTGKNVAPYCRKAPTAKPAKQ